MSDGNSHALDAFLAITPDVASADIEVVVRDLQGSVNVRGGQNDLASVVKSLASADLPARANTFSPGECELYWLGPDEWLALSREPMDIVEWRDKLASAGGSVVDMSDGYVRLDISGKSVREVLAKGCTLDLHPDCFQRGDCAQTAIARGAVLIARAAGENSFVLVVRRSFAEYLALWLRQAAAEFGVTFRRAS